MIVGVMPRSGHGELLSARCHMARESIEASRLSGGADFHHNRSRGGVAPSAGGGNRTSEPKDSRRGRDPQRRPFAGTANCWGGATGPSEYLVSKPRPPL